MQAIIFVGIQATGKSTLYRERFFTTHIRINLDMLRTRHRECLLVQACIAAKQPFVVDNTNLSAQDRARYITIAADAGFNIVGYYFRSAIGDALERNNKRTGRERVPDKGMLGAYRRLEIPRFEEGFNALYHVSLSLENEFIIREWSDEVR